MRMHVITNYGGGKNYTPFVTPIRDEAEITFKSLVIGNLEQRYGEEKLFKNGIRMLSFRALVDKYSELKDDVNFIHSEELEGSNNILVSIGDPEEGGNVIQWFMLEV